MRRVQGYKMCCGLEALGASISRNSFCAQEGPDSMGPHHCGSEHGRGKYFVFTAMLLLFAILSVQRYI